MKIKNLGQIYSYVRGTNPPTNTEIFWYDTGASLMKFYFKGAWIPVVTNNLGQISLTSSDTPDYLANKIDSTLTVTSNVLGVTDPVKYGINVITTVSSSIANITNEYDILEVSGASDLNILDIQLNSTNLPNGFNIKIVNMSATYNVFLNWTFSTQAGFNGSMATTFVNKGSNFTSDSPTSSHKLYPYESALLIKYGTGKWYIADIWEVKKTAYNKDFGSIVGTIPAIGSNLAASKTINTDANSKLKTV